MTLRIISSTNPSTAVRSGAKPPTSSTKVAPAPTQAFLRAGRANHAAIAMLFGTPVLFLLPEPRFAASSEKAQAPERAVAADVKLTGAARSANSSALLAIFVVLTLFDIFAGNGPEVGPQSHAAIPPEPKAMPTEPEAVQARPQPSNPRSSRRSWVDNLPSRAGFEASGIPIVARHTTSEPAHAARREPVEPVRTESQDSAEAQVIARERQQVLQQASDDARAAARLERPTTVEAPPAVDVTPAASFSLEEYAAALARTADDNALPSVATHATTLPQYDLQEYANVLATQRPADATESPAAQPQIQYEHDPKVFAQYANALAQPSAGEPSSDDQPRSGAAS